MSEPETAEEAARHAARRWRLVSAGLALVFVTNLINVALNAAGLQTGTVKCITIIGWPSAEQTRNYGVDRRRASILRE